MLVIFLSMDDFAMNHRSPGSLPVSKAIVGFLSFKTAEGLADRTIDSYQRQLQKWLEYLGDKEVVTITVGELTKYLSWLLNEYVPHSFGGGKDRLSPKTLRNLSKNLKPHLSNRADYRGNFG